MPNTFKSNLDKLEPETAKRQEANIVINAVTTPTEKEGEWGEELNSILFNNLDMENVLDCERPMKSKLQGELKSFIRKTLHSREKEIREGLAEKVGGLEISYEQGLKVCDPTDEKGENHKYNCHFKKGFNQALEDIKTLINKDKEINKC